MIVVDAHKPSSQPRVAIALHDVSPSTLELSQRLIALVDSIAGNVPLTLLVIPHHHGQQRIDRCPQFRRFIDARIAAGDEVALHGMSHRDDMALRASVPEWWRRRVLTQGEAEFAALSADDARQRIEQGLALFATCGWTAAGFVAPAWQMSQATRAVIREFPFRYATTRSAVLWMPEDNAQAMPALSLSARTAMRRRLSQWWAARWMQLHGRDGVIRLALHPVDAAFTDMCEVWRECLQTLLAVASPVTKSRLLETNACYRSPGDNEMPARQQLHAG